MIKVAVLGEDGITGKAVISRLQKEKAYTYEKNIKQADLIVASPGIPTENYPETDLEIISEIEFAFKLNKSKVIAITGTNGKTTTATLISKLLGVPAVGNIGEPYVSITKEHPYLAVEVSSYQLETIKDFKPYISIILNVTEDHLTRHKTLDNYAAVKANIFKNQTAKDHLIYNLDDPYIVKQVQNAKCSKLGFCAKKPFDQNFTAARLAAKLCGRTDDEIDQVFSDFQGVEHRFEKVGVIKGVKVINDSKATNVDSVIVALSNFEPQENIVLIAGGRDKHTDLVPLKKAMQGKVKKLILLGEAKNRFNNELDNVEKSCVENYQEAVDLAFKTATAGDTILLSPACASWDMFKNFEERGNYFKELVKDHDRS